MSIELLSGNEAIAQGAWECGVAVGVGYPGTPSTETLENLAKHKDVYCEWAPNEKVALEVGIGAAMGGVRALVTMKHVGVNVAADPLMSVCNAGVNGGLVILAADDPSIYSSQNEQDSRNYAAFARIPMLEPSNSAEAHSMVQEAFEISERFDTPVFIRETVRIAHTKTLVDASDTRQVLEPKPYANDASKWDVKIDESLENFDNGFDFIFTVPVYPEVSVGEYKGIEAERADDSVSEDDVNAELNRLAERDASTETAERPAQNGDTVVIDFEGFVDGEAFEGGKGEDYSLKLGSGTFIPGFEDQLVGKSAGESCDVNVTFPEEYQAAELAGKPAVFKCTVKSVQETILPEIDDEFAKDVSEFETLDELKKDTEKKIAESKKNAADRNFEEKILDKVLETLEADIPEAMFEAQLDNVMQDYGYRIQSQGISLEDYVKQMGMDMASFRNIFRDQAERQVKVQLALKKISELENIEPSEDEIEAEYKRLAESYGLEEDQVKKYVPVDSVKSDLTTQKTLDMLKENAVAVAPAADAE